MENGDSREEAIQKLLADPSSVEMSASGAASSTPNPSATQPQQTPRSSTPLVYQAVRAVGVLKPKFQRGQTRAFADSLEVLGTAFWLNGYDVLVTCAHVVDDLVGAPIEVTGLLVTGNAGNYVRAQVSQIDLAHDLAVLTLVDAPRDFVEKETATGLKVVDRYPTVGAGVAYAGFPLGIQLLDASHAPTYAEGVVGAQLRRQPFRKDIQITGTVAGGFSGAPVVLKDHPDEIVGVLSNSPKEAATNIFMAISWEHVRAIAQLAAS